MMQEESQEEYGQRGSAASAAKASEKWEQENTALMGWTTAHTMKSLCNLAGELSLLAAYLLPAVTYWAAALEWAMLRQDQ